MNNFDNLESLSDKELADLTKKIVKIQEAREKRNIEIMQTRDAKSLKHYLEKHDYHLSLEMKSNMVFSQFSLADIAFYETFKKTSSWENFKKTSHFSEIMYYVFSDEKLLEYFIKNDKNLLVEFITDNRIYGSIEESIVEKLYQYKIVDLSLPGIEKYFLENPHEELLKYGLKNDLLKFNQKQLKTIFINQIGKFDPNLLDLVKNKIADLSDLNFKTLLKCMDKENNKANEFDFIFTLYEEILTLEDKNFLYLLENFCLDNESLGQLLVQFASNGNKYHQKLNLLTKNINDIQTNLKECFINFENLIGKSMPDDFREIYNLSKLYLKLENEKIVTKTNTNKPKI